LIMEWSPPMGCGSMGGERAFAATPQSETGPARARQ